MGSILLATNNPGKLQLFRRVFAAFDLVCLSLSEIGVTMDVDETGVTPEENALLKARAVWEPGRLVFADDAGMEVDALGGEPGVQTRRWNGKFTDEVPDEEWLDYLLMRLDGVPLEQRTAKFVSGWALKGPTGEEGVRRLISPFVIAEHRIRPMSPGFPVSAVSMELHRSEPRRSKGLADEMMSWDHFRWVVGKETAGLKA